MNKKILHRVFEHIAENFSDRIAVEEAYKEEQQGNQQRTITYRELNAGANKIAHALEEIGVKEDVVVGLSLPGGIDYIIATLAVLKVGGVFMPLDADAPPKRLEFMLRKTEPHIIINRDKSFTILRENKSLLNKNKSLTTINREGSSTVNLETDKFSDENLEFTPDPQSANYIIFTSGSTGEPKAILGKHVSLSHFIHWEISTFGLDENVRASLFAPTTFDVSFRDIFVPLLCGGTVCIPQLDTMRNTPRLVDWLESSRITLVHCVPTMFRLIRKELKSRKAVYELSKTKEKAHKDVDNEYKSTDSYYNPLPEMQNILLAGEALYGSDVIELMDLVGERIKLTNLYGPSETTLAKIYYRIKDKPVEPNRIIPLGEPISNTAILILKDNRLCKVGEIGEIHIKTPFCSHGYYKERELTAQSFIENPLTTEQDIIYKTGDLGRYLPDHQVEFIGRLDSQVKINGIRIELSEIESHLFAHKAIERPVVVAHAAAEHESKLVCYYTLKENVQSLKERDSVNSMKRDDTDNDSKLVENIDVNPASLRAYLADFLPSYMIPSFFVRLNEFPLNLNGKIDRRRLPKPEDLLYDRIPYAPPADEQERKLAAIFSEVLGIDKVGVNTPFFDLGGNSLNAIRIISRIFAEFRVEIAIRDFFENPSIGQLSRLLDDSSKTNVNKTKDISASDNSFLTIQPVPLAENYPVSHAQRRIWILEKLDPNFIAYNIPGAYLIEGELDIPRLKAAFLSVINRHESLRTTFIAVDGNPRQVIHDKTAFDLKVFVVDDGDSDGRGDVGGVTSSQSITQQMDRVKEFVALDAVTPFDLENGPLIRGSIFKTAQGYVIAINIHHIISDAISMDILINELLTFYHASIIGKSNPLAPLSINYKDYVVWSLAQEQEEKMKAAKEYWHSCLSGELPLLNLPLDATRPAIQTSSGSHIQFEIAPSIYNRLNRFGQANRASLFMVLTALIKILLYRYSGQEDIVIGTPITMRNHSQLENQIGLYINLLTLRDHINETDSFTDVLAKVKETCTASFEHKIYPFDRLVGELVLDRDLTRAPVFDVVVVLHIRELDEQSALLNLKASPISFANPTSKYDLTFSFTADSESIEVEIEYNSDLFKETTIKRLINHFNMLTENALDNPLKTISALNILSQDERKLILDDFNSHTRPFPDDKTLSDLFELQVRKTPNNTALIYHDISLSYYQLNSRANGVARYLREECNIVPDMPVAVLLERGVAMIESLLGILKAGGTYLPLDPESPFKRVEYIFKDSRAKILICSSSTLEIADTRNPEYLINIDEIDFSPQDNLGPAARPFDLAYIIYTSGSTGAPKGVMVEHRGFINMIFAQIEGFGVNEDDRVLQFASSVFDASLSEIFMALLSGAALVVIDKNQIEHHLRFLEYLSRNSVSVTILPPVYLNTLEHNHLPTIKTLITAGEPAIKDDALFYSRIKNYFNAYGPTETSVCATFHKVDSSRNYGDIIPIGPPIANSSIYILDKHFNPVPIGIAGELYFAGVGVARGYIGRDDLTREKFIPNPFNSRKRLCLGSDRLYRIGDIGRWLPTGDIEFLGRTDDQVKIRGFRIELGEIEAALKTFPGVTNALVQLWKDANGMERLCGYLVISNPPSTEEIINFISKLLPNYMIPTFFVFLDKFPININGKIDKKLLPQPQIESVKTDIGQIEPRNLEEELLVRVWKKILGVQHITIFDNYFYLGGDSIKAIQMVSFLAHENHVVEVREIFQNPTISDLARYIRPAKIVVEQSPVTGVVPLTPIQEWFFAHHKTSRNHFNQAQLILSSELMNPDALKKALIAVQNHHDSLRMTYTFIDEKKSVFNANINVNQSSLNKANIEKIIQENQDINFPVDFEFVDLTNVDLINTLNPLDASASIDDLSQLDKLSKIIDSVQSSMDLTKGPLMKSRLIRMPDGDRLLLVLHHLIVDGVSWRILAEDIHTAYSQIKAGVQASLPPKTHSFKTWAEKIRQFALDSTFESNSKVNSDSCFNSESNFKPDTKLELKLKDEIDYWERVENYKVTALPFSCGDSEIQIKIASNGQVYQRDTETLNITLDAEHTEQLLGTAHQSLRTQTNDILLTALARALSAWHGQSATRIMLEGHGREEIFKDIDINRTVGWFTTIYPLVLEFPENNDDISYQVKHIKETLRKIPNNGFGYGILRYLTSKNLNAISNKSDPINGNLNVSKNINAVNILSCSSVPAISFNYLGRFDTDIAQGFSIAPESSGQCIGSDVEITQDIDINAIVTEKGLEISLTYNRKALTKDSMQNLLEKFKLELEIVIEYLINKAETSLTPSDIDFDGLGIDELDKVLDSIG
ncbi:MAG: amino acid adenylation domain-containing protein [Desulfamplus sp.]|nr:amino acid adenylation domain-containing protein [Desulfamplus sp.]